MHSYTPTLFSELEDIPDAAIKDFTDDKLCVPDDPIEGLPFDHFADSWFFQVISNEGDFEEEKLFSQEEGQPLENLPGWRVPKKLRTKRVGRESWSLYPPLWHLNSTATRFEAKKTCMHCRATDTPQWRTGPAGPATLCNACGIRFKSGRLLPEYRPVASPTYTDSDFSNRHKRVLKIRESKTGL